MTNPDNVGGLPELPAWMSDYTIPNDEFEVGKDVRLSDRMRAYGELCRAAPAGGDDYKAIETALHDAKMTIEILRAGYARMAEAAGCVEDCGKASAIVLAINALRDQANRNDIAPAGSGEVEELAQWLDAKYARHGEIEDKRAAALLRKLQQGVE